MRAVVLKAYGDRGNCLACEEIDTPKPKRGQVLVKVAAAPINPSDLAFVDGNYGIRKVLPTVPGFEGAGVVVAANAGLYGRWLVGQRVACIAPEDGPGTWAEYAACNVGACVPLGRNTSMEFGASLIVNPVTAISLLERARQYGSRAVVQTAAASALGRMISRAAALRGMPVINVVRRDEVAAKLIEEGREHVLNSESPDFERQLRDLSQRLGATVVIDAVAGDLTGIVARAMPVGSKVIVFGGLSAQDPGLSIPNLIFEGKSLEGFWLPVHLRKVGLLKTLAMFREVQGAGELTFGTSVQARLPLERVHDGVALQQAHGTEGKVLLVP